MSMELHDEASVDMDAICRKVSEMVDAELMARMAPAYGYAKVTLCPDCVEMRACDEDVGGGYCPLTEMVVGRDSFCSWARPR
jgi:hypothetical protein